MRSIFDSGLIDTGARVLRPCRVHLEFDFLDTYMNWLWNRRDVTLPDYYELLAMYQVAKFFHTTRRDEIARIKQNLGRVEAQATRPPHKYDPTYLALLRDYWILLYAPYVQYEDVWYKFAEVVDKCAGAIPNWAYEDLSSKIQEANIEIQNIHRAWDHAPLVPFPGVKTYATFDSLHDEINGLCQWDAVDARRDFLHTKVRLARDAGLISLQQEAWLHNHLLETGPTKKQRYPNTQSLMRELNLFGEALSKE